MQVYTPVTGIFQIELTSTGVYDYENMCIKRYNTWISHLNLFYPVAVLLQFECITSPLFTHHKNFPTLILTLHYSS